MYNYGLGIYYQKVKTKTKWAKGLSWVWGLGVGRCMWQSPHQAEQWNTFTDPLPQLPVFPLMLLVLQTTCLCMSVLCLAYPPCAHLLNSGHIAAPQ